MNTQTKQNNMQPNKDYYGVKFPPIKQEQPNSNIEQAAKNESVRVVSEYYPFDRDEKWYKHGLALAEKMFTKGALWQQSQLPEQEQEVKAVVNTSIQDISEAIGKIDAALKSREVKAVGDAEIEKMYAFEVWKEKALAYVNNLQKTSQRYGHGNYIEDLLSYIQENVVYPLKIAALQRGHHELDLDLIKEYGYLEQHDVPMSKAALQPEVIPADFKEVTGFDTPKEMSAYNKGREDEEAVFMKFISEWDGHTKSYFGQVMKNTFDRLAALQPEAEKITEQIAAYVHEIDSLRETNRKLGEKIAELQSEVDG